MKQLAIILIACSVFGCQSPDGGYNYPAHVDAGDTLFYSYPIKDSLSKRDSFYWFCNHLFYQMLQEPNISLKPLEHETYRLQYSNAFGQFLLITLCNNSITVKEGNSGNAYIQDESALTATELTHLHILQRYYPIDSSRDYQQKPYLDSLLHASPQLRQASYYYSLLRKSFRINKKAFSYTTKKITLSPKTFDSIVNAIDASGFWKLPFKIDCNVELMDGDGFHLEANTKHKYQIVQVQGRPGDTTRFTKICQRIFDYAKPTEPINLIWSGKKEMVEPQE